MRLHFQLSPNHQTVPFDYPHFLTGAFHRWLGDNELHDGLSLYSLGWLQGGCGRGNGLSFPNGASWFISAPDTEAGAHLLGQLVAGAGRCPQVCCGMEVTEISSQSTPDFGEQRVFRANSPIFLRGDKTGEEAEPHLIYSDDRADAALTEALRKKLSAAGLGEHAQSASVRFDRSFKTPKTRLIGIGPTKKRVNVCPVVVEGSETAVRFAWNVGAGHLTGCAFGSLI